MSPPIADCGFPPISLVPGSNPPRLVVGKEALVEKGPTTPVAIGFAPGLFHVDQATVQATVQSLIGAPPPPQLVEALIDTGARESCIDENLAVTLQLPLVDRVKAAGVGGGHEFNVYLGYIRIVALNQVQYGRFMGVKLRDGGQPHHVLLGRTLLQGMILVYDGRDGSCRLAT
jgi:predicted aspartyl protease